MKEFPYAAYARLLPTAAHRDHFAHTTLRKRSRQCEEERVSALYRHTLRAAE